MAGQKCPAITEVIMRTTRVEISIAIQRRKMRESAARNQPWLAESVAACFVKRVWHPEYTWNAKPIYVSAYVR